MISRLAQAAAGPVARDKSKARDFYLEICRCLPFIHRLHKLEEMVTMRDFRAIIKERFQAYKDVKDPRVTDILIFKGREELETFLMMHKQRHHAITEYLEPFSDSKVKVTKASSSSGFLNSFYDTAYPQIAKKA